MTNNVKQLISDRRTELRMSKTELATKIGISPRQFYRIEDGNMSAETFLKICQALDLEINLIPKGVIKKW